MKIIKNNNRNIHRPLHIYNGHTYFLTARCHRGFRYFKDDRKKDIFLKVLQEAVNRFNINIYAWVLLDNHYHMMFSLPPEEIDRFRSAQSVTPNNHDESPQKSRSDKMSKANFVKANTYVLTELVRKLHKDTSRILNQLDKKQKRKIWHQYWDYCIRNEKDFWTHFNYIVKNPFKHGLVDRLSEAYEYPYSSNPTWLERWGAEGLSYGFTQYPIVDWAPIGQD